jgi:hypothetical protein
MPQMVYIFFCSTPTSIAQTAAGFAAILQAAALTFSHTVFCILNFNTNNILIYPIFHVLGQEFAPLYFSFSHIIIHKGEREVMCLSREGAISRV